MKKRTKQRGCVVLHCTNHHLAKGRCQKHYSEQRRREEGVAERGAPKEVLISFLAEEELDALLREKVPHRERSGFIRSAIWERLAGTGVL